MRDVELPEGGGEVEHELDALHAALDDGAVGHRSDDHFRTHRAKRIALQPVLVVERYDVVTRFAQPTDQRGAGEARATRD